MHPDWNWPGWHYENPLWKQANLTTGTLGQDVAGAYSAWSGVYGPAGSVTTGGTTGTGGSGSGGANPAPAWLPGLRVIPAGGTGGPEIINLAPLLGGGPASPVFDVTGTSQSATGAGFAGGGTVYLGDVAGMFALGGYVPVTAGPGSMPMGIPASSLIQQPGGPGGPRTLSDAAQASRVGLQIQGDLTINNPVAQTTEDSIARTSNRLAFMAGRGVA